MTASMDSSGIPWFVTEQNKYSPLSALGAGMVS